MAERIRQGLSDESQPAIETRYDEFQRKKRFWKSATSSWEQSPPSPCLELSPNVSHRNRDRSLSPRNRPVKRVAFDRLAPCGADQPLQFLAAHALWSGRTRVVVDLLLD